MAFEITERKANGMIRYKRRCECGHQHSIGSRQELYEMSGMEEAKTVEFHRPYIDAITLNCPKCGKKNSGTVA